jgi:enamine deaminase RidA (YjgF/YER057c/UK114 family)
METSRPRGSRTSAGADLVKTTIFYADVDDFAVLNEVYARHMPDPPLRARRPG